MQNQHTFRTTRKIMERSELAEELEKVKSAGKTVVFTNGCFDILHIGHVRYLQDARALGDVLVIGVNDDDSVRRLKGPDRPINYELDRAELLAAFECVDYVSLFDEDTPVELIQALRPDVHVKGGDYRPDDLPEAKVVRSYGGQVKIISFSITDTEGRSTTNVINKMKKG